MEEDIETKKKRKWPKILIWTGVIVFIAAAVGVNLYYTQMQNPITAEGLVFTTVKGQTMEDTLIAQGKVVPQDIVYIYRDPSKGSIAEVYVKEGDMVKKGDELIRYEGADTGKQQESLELQKERLQLQINHLEEKIADLQEQIEEAEDKGLPDSTIDQLQQQKDEAAFQNKLSELELEQVNAQVEEAREQEGDLVVNSNISGVVQSVSQESSASGNGTEPVITVVSGKPYEIRGTLTEYDVVDVKKGNAVTIEAKALGDGQQWKGKVAEIGTVPVQQNTTVTAAALPNQQSVTSYPFTVRLDGKAENLRRGFHVTVEIVIDKHENVPVLPFDAILTVQDKEYVFVVKNGKLDRRLIQTGLVNEEYKEVTSGISIGDKVVLHPSNDLEEGMKVVSADDQAK